MQNTEFGNTVRSMVNEADAELSRLITYINDAVVPEVRRTTASGLRTAAEQLGRLAAQMDRPPAHRATARPSHANGSPSQAAGTASGATL